MKLVVTNKTPSVVSIPGGNYQEVTTPAEPSNGTELRVSATGRGNFQIDAGLDVPRCPCAESAQPEFVSTASQPVPVVVPRRVLATIAAGTPVANLATAQAVALANGVSVVEVVPLLSANAALVVFEIQDGLGAIAKAVALAADPRVTLAQADFVYDTSQGENTPSELTYGVQMIGADLIHNVSRGDGIRVAMIDAGVDTGHTALTRKVAELADVTGTGWTPDVHGTLVAGVIAAESSSTGSSGVAPGVQLVAIKSCVAQSARGAAARCWSSTLAKGLDLAIQKNVRVANLSVGGPEDKLLARLVDSAVRKGIAVVSAAGNDGPSGKPSYPAAFENVIAVTAVDATSRLYPRATRGGFVDVAAPGVDVLSTGPGGRTQLFSGTSAATAFTSGAVALLLQQRPALNQAELSTLLRDTAKDLGAAGPDSEFGYGLLDVCRATARVSNRQLTCR
jgi:subtilisin family serine protease